MARTNKVQAPKPENTEAAIEALETAKRLAKEIIDWKAVKKEADEIIKQNTAELTELSKKNPQWFEVEGEKVNTAVLGETKLVWKKPATSYTFNHKDVEVIANFIETYPKSIDFKLKAMQNIDFNDWGITAHVAEPKLEVE
jgi:vacuolar-type H+-ATPase subunit H